MRIILVLASFFVLSGCETLDVSTVSVSTGVSTYHPVHHRSYIRYTLGYYGDSYYHGYRVHGDYGHRYYYAPRHFRHHRHYARPRVIVRHHHHYHDRDRHRNHDRRDHRRDDRRDNRRDRRHDRREHDREHDRRRDRDRRYHKK